MGQWGQAVLNHNSIVRVTTLFPVFAKANLARVQRMCLLLYLYPFLTLIPIYFAFIETFRLGKALTTSPWNTVVSKFLFMGIVIVTEVFATVTDILLLNRIEAVPYVSPKKAAKSKRAVHLSYWGIWIFMLADLTLKVLITQGYPVLFDGITTIILISLRTQSNLNYGLLLKDIMNTSKSTSNSPSRNKDNSTVVTEDIFE